MSEREKNIFFRILENPVTIILGMILGIFIGIYKKDFVPIIAPVGEIYLAFLQMTIIPVMATAVVVSIGKVVKARSGKRHLFTKIMALIAVFLIIAALIGAVTSIVLKPIIHLDSDMKNHIGKIIIAFEEETKKHENTSSEKDKGEVESKKEHESFVPLIKEISSESEEKLFDEDPFIVRFIMEIIPENIFRALSTGENMKILFFFMILGVMIKYISEKSGDNIIRISEGIYEAVQKMLDLTICVLPFSLCSLAAIHVSKAGFESVKALSGIIISVYVAGIIIVFICSIIIWKFMGGNYFKQFAALKDPILIAIGTGSNFGAIPSTLHGLTEHYKMDTDKANMVIPLGITMGRCGSAMAFGLVSMFVLQLYDFPVTLLEFAIIVVLSAFVAMGTSESLFFSAAMLSVVLIPLGVPYIAGVIVLLVLDAVLDPITTLVDVYPSCAIAAIVSKGDKT